NERHFPPPAELYLAPRPVQTQSRPVASRRGAIVTPAAPRATERALLSPIMNRMFLIASRAEPMISTGFRRTHSIAPDDRSEHVRPPQAQANVKIPPPDRQRPRSRAGSGIGLRHTLPLFGSLTRSAPKEPHHVPPTEGVSRSDPPAPRAASG